MDIHDEVVDELSFLSPELFLHGRRKRCTAIISRLLRRKRGHATYKLWRENAKQSWALESRYARLTIISVEPLGRQTVGKLVVWCSESD